MADNGFMIKKLQSLKYMMKSLGIISVIPIIVNNIITPIMVFITYQYYGMDEHTLNNIIYYVQILSPFFSTFWIYMNLIKYIDINGREIFYMKNKVKIKEVIMLFLVYTLLSSVPFIWYIKMYPKLVWELIHLIIVYLFLASLAYFLSYLLKSVLYAIIPTLCYTFLSMTLLKNNKVAVWSYYEPNGMSVNALKEKYVWFIIMAILFLIVGGILNKKYEN